MHAQSAAQPDSPVVVTPPIQPRRPWRVETVTALPEWRLHVRFVDGTEGTVELMALIHSPTAGVFAALADPARFAQVFVSHGAVTWPGDLDLAPDAMYAAIRQSGTWVVT